MTRRSRRHLRRLIGSLHTQGAQQRVGHAAQRDAERLDVGIDPSLLEDVLLHDVSRGSWVHGAEDVHAVKRIRAESAAVEEDHTRGADGSVVQEHLLAGAPILSGQDHESAIGLKNLSVVLRVALLGNGEALGRLRGRQVVEEVEDRRHAFPRPLPGPRHGHKPTPDRSCTAEQPCGGEITPDVALASLLGSAAVPSAHRYSSSVNQGNAPSTVVEASSLGFSRVRLSESKSSGTCDPATLSCAKAYRTCHPPFLLALLRPG
eukprot:scaffold731_cov261-Pinguiococcus_pyrenoidosus.AAC.21